MVTLDKDEKIIKVVRRHFIVLIPMFFFILLIAVLPLFLSAIITSDFLKFDPEFTDFVSQFLIKWKTFGYLIWLLILWVIMFMEWTDYYLDMWVITDKRIIDVEQRGFFRRDVTSFDYGKIQNIRVQTDGLIQTFLKYGNLHIETAGTEDDILIRDAHYPEDARSLILGLQEKAQGSSGV